ncbi:MAG: Rieske 2Fe-2S domain-containing protein [Deltaproteobacteria bacterium]|nr:Rieske 2Fe-2S domain-containing protein [Deltaproteobacteria bacterium]
MTSPVSRRKFLFNWLVIAGLGSIGTALTWIFGNVWTAASRFSSGSWVQISPMNRFAPGTLTPFPEHKIAVIRSSRRIGAIGLECTHLGCLLNVVDQGFFCPCHGSEFGPLGQVYSGPATDPLPWHEVTERDGRLWVHIGEKLTRSSWLEIREPGPDQTTRHKA